MQISLTTLDKTTVLAGAGGVGEIETGTRTRGLNTGVMNVRATPCDSTGPDARRLNRRRGTRARGRTRVSPPPSAPPCEFRFVFVRDRQRFFILFFFTSTFVCVVAYF